MKTPQRTTLIVLGVIILLYLIYAGIYIYRTSFIAFGERYFVLFDDAMISMRYAKNLIAGNGLVWNPGEQPVEGYTNPLWVLYMSLFHFFPIPPSKICLFIQMRCRCTAKEKSLVATQPTGNWLQNFWNLRPKDLPRQRSCFLTLRHQVGFCWLFLIARRRILLLSYGKRALIRQPA